MKKIPCFGWKAVKLADLPFEDLTELMRRVEQEPANRNPQGGIYLYTRSARRKLDAISWAIAHKLARKKAESPGGK